MYWERWTRQVEKLVNNFVHYRAFIIWDISIFKVYSICLIEQYTIIQIQYRNYGRIMNIHYYVYSSINLFMYCVLFLGPSDWNRYWTWKLFESNCHGSKNFKPNRRTGGREHNTKEIGRNEPTLELPESQKYCNKVSNYFDL